MKDGELSPLSLDKPDSQFDSAGSGFICLSANLHKVNSAQGRGRSSTQEYTSENFLGRSIASPARQSTHSAGRPNQSFVTSVMVQASSSRDGPRRETEAVFN